MSHDSTESIQNNLKKLGFTEYEAKVYLSLLNEHPLSAYNISKTSGVPHSRVYDITRRLIRKSYVTSKGTNPELFSPISPEELVLRMQQDNNKLTEELKQQFDSIKFIADFDPVWNISGRTEAVEMSVKMINDAKTSIFAGLWDQELEELEPFLKAAEERGIQVHLLLYGHSKPRLSDVYYHSIQNLGDINELGRSLDLVVDSNICITGTLGGLTPCQTVWTRNKGLIKSIEGFIIHDFYIAEVSDYLGDKVEEIFGRNFEKLRKKYGH